MSNLFNSRNLYKLIVCIFLLVIILKMKEQLLTLKNYNAEISILEEKIATLREQENMEKAVNSTNLKEDNENMARKDLKMYYPNETPFKGY